MKRKKLLLLASFSFVCCMLLPMPVNGEYVQVFDSEGRIGFYGSYPIDKPTPPGSEIPISKPNSVVEKLPQTGTKKSCYIESFGVMFITTAFIIIYRKKRRGGISK